MKKEETSEKFQDGTSHVAGVGRVRRLGKFPTQDELERELPIRDIARSRGLPDPDPHEGTQKGGEAGRRSSRHLTRPVLALALIAAGTMILSTGVALTYGWQWGLITLGVFVLVVGFAMAFTT